MSYRRRSNWQNSYSSYSSITRVSVHWSAKSSAYSVNFSDTKHWNEMQVLIGFIKGLNVGEKDVLCDESSGKKVWTWYFIEKYVDAFNEMVKLMPTIFELDFMSKPTGQTNMAQFIPVDVYLSRFLELTGQDIKDKDYNDAKRIYRQWQRKNHPDVGGDKDIASSVNECWSALELNYFKSRKEVEYATT
jgi:hypothetical protein